MEVADQETYHTLARAFTNEALSYRVEMLVHRNEAFSPVQRAAILQEAARRLAMRAGQIRT